MNVLLGIGAFDYQYLFILLLVFISVILVVVCVAYVYFNKNELSGRLNRLVGKEPPAQVSAEKPNLIDKSSQGLTAKLSKPLIKVSLSDPAAKTSKNRVRLMQAGFRSRKAFFNFYALKTAGLVVFPGIFMMGMLFLKVTPERMLLLVLLALFGFFLPDIILYLLISQRKQDLSHALPDALDLMVVCVEAGLGIDMTFKRVGEEIRAISKDLSDEFLLTNLEVRSGQSRQESFKNMALRTGVQEISQLMSMLNQTNRFGTSLANALRVHSDAMRIKRRQTAEEIAAKAAIKLLFPLAFCIFPALFVVLLGPAVIRVLRVLIPSLGGG